MGEITSKACHSFFLITSLSVLVKLMEAVVRVPHRLLRTVFNIGNAQVSDLAIYIRSLAVRSQTFAQTSVPESHEPA